MLYIYIADIIEDIKPEAGSAAEKMKIMYDSCINLGKFKRHKTDFFLFFVPMSMCNRMKKRERKIHAYLSLSSFLN